VLRNKSQTTFTFHSDFRYGAYIALCFIFLIGCSSQTCRQWEIDEIITKTPCFNGGRLILEPDSNCSNLEIELVRNSSGIRFYVNLLFLKAFPWPEDPARTTLSIQFEGQEAWIIHPYVLEGGQRLLIPGDVADTLVQSLLDGFCFTIQIGRSQISVVPDKFIELYKRLLDLPIEEQVEDHSCSEEVR
jgi:hypothetical protein